MFPGFEGGTTTHAVSQAKNLGAALCSSLFPTSYIQLVFKSCECFLLFSLTSSLFCIPLANLYLGLSPFLTCLLHRHFSWSPHLQSRLLDWHSSQCPQDAHSKIHILQRHPVVSEESKPPDMANGHISDLALPPCQPRLASPHSVLCTLTSVTTSGPQSCHCLPWQHASVSSIPSSRASQLMIVPTGMQPGLEAFEQGKPECESCPSHLFKPWT